MKKRRGLAAQGFSRKSRTQSRPSLERFEDRLLLTIFTVTNTSDSAQAVANDGSLRGEILASNATTSALPNQIVFSLPAGLQTISPVAPLPALTEPVLVDGSSVNGFTTQPLIQILGSANFQGGAGLTLSTSGIQIQDLIIDGFTGDGIDVEGGGNDLVAGCYIGTDPTGTSVVPNRGVGILVASPNNLIGNTPNNGNSFSTLPNIISGNSVGIQITGTTNTQNVVSNNFVGTDVTGTLRLGNTNYGIEVNSGGSTGQFGNSTNGNTIGGLSSGGTLGDGNLISGNTAGGLDISGSGANENIVEGNFIGTDITGLLSVANNGDGIDLNGVTFTSIGGTTSGTANVVSGNSGDGIQISGATSMFNSIEGNNIGVGSDGVTAVGNRRSGVVINGANDNVVGGTDFVTNPQNPTPYGNIIAFNGLGATTNYGVEILGGNGDGILSNSIFGNGGLGIKLNQGNSGVVPPTLISSESGAGETEISGTYTGSPNESYRIQFFSSQTPNASGAGDGQTFLGNLDITTDKIGNATFTTILNTPVPVGDSVSATATDGVLTLNNTSQFAVNVQDTQAPVTDLQVTTTAVPTTGPLFDQDYTYTLTITNNGPNDDTNVTLTDTIPTTSTFVSSSGGTFVKGVLTDNIGTLTDGESEMVTITVKPNSLSGAFSNTASVTGDGLDPDLTNNTSTTTATVAPNSDLSVLITPAFTGTNVPLGSPITYAITVSNFGPNAASGVTTIVNLPISFTDVTVVPDTGTYSIDNNNNVTITTGLLGVSSSSTILITVTPQATSPPNYTVTATVSTSTGLADPNPANNKATNTVTVANAADLAIGIDANPDPVLIGQELIYTLTLTNNGPSPASQPVVTDVLPANVTFIPGDSSAGGNGTISISDGVVTATMNALVPGDVDTITIAVVPSVSGQITNTVNVADPTLDNPDEIDTNLANNTATVTTQVSPADVGVTINNPADPLFIGTQAIFQVVVTNSGPAPATNVVLTDTFGSGATILTTSFGTISGNTITADLGTLASGASETITIDINPTASGVLIDSAAVSASEFDPDSNNNSATSSNLVSPVDLGVSVTPSATTILTGQPLTYDVTVTNFGPATATNVLFSNLLPANVIVDSIISSQGTLSSSGTVISGNLGSIGAGGTATIIFTVTPTTVETAVNTTTVTSDDVDTNTANNSVTTTVNVINLPGSIQFDSSLELVGENAGSVTLTVDRTGGTAGVVTVDYATSDYTAVAGVNYVATSGTLTFADGQSTATITIPVLDDGKVDGNFGFFVTLSNATGGAALGTGSVTGVIVANTDRDTIPPIVTGLIGIPNGNTIKGFTVTFDKAMNPGPATLLSNYHVYLEGANGSQTPVPLAGISYDPFGFAITIIPTAPVPANKFYHIIINGSVGDPLTDTSGNVLYGSSGLGTNYDVIYGQGTNLTYNDAMGNKVNLKLTNGGTMGIFLAPNGEAIGVDLYQIVPRKSKLSGTVTKLSKKASGYTTIGFINGFGNFGDVYSSVTTPSFYVASDPVAISSVKTTSAGNVKALSLPTSEDVTKTVTKTITSKSKTPKAPKVKIG